MIPNDPFASGTETVPVPEPPPCRLRRLSTLSPEVQHRLRSAARLLATGAHRLALQGDDEAATPTPPAKSRGRRRRRGAGERRWTASGAETASAAPEVE